jgi:glucose/arabinose dehydrogenase
MHHEKYKWFYLVIALELAIIVCLIVWAIMSKTGQDTQRPEVQKQVNLQTPKIEFTQFAAGLASPTNIIASSDISDARLFVTEQTGKIQTIDQQGKLGSQPFLDITSKVQNTGEMGLLGLAFHPSFLQNGYFYVNYVDKEQNTVIARYSTNKQTKLGDPTTEKVILKLKQPYANHNGGGLQFGPDGYLYIGMGDGGSAGDPQNRAQDKTSLFGKMLRLDVDKGDPYSVPGSNPFISDLTVKPEIWAAGLRNPWRFSFDKATGDLYIADVGQGEIEEINYQAAANKAGQNYGWRCFEGSKPYNTAGCDDASQYTKPIVEYTHADKRCSVTGGYVYRGTTEKALNSKYFYGDYCGGQVYYAAKQNGTWVVTLAATTAYAISTFGQDQSGNLYLADYSTGTIYRLQDTAN